MAQLVGVVLAGGEGRRLGQPKGSLEWEGLPLAERAARTLGPLCGTVLISLAPDAENPAPGYPVVFDSEPAGRGPLAGIQAAFAASGNADLLVLACDYPRVETELLEAVIGNASDDDELVIATDGRGRDHPLVGLWRRAMETHVRTALDLGLLKVRSILADVRLCRVEPLALPVPDPDEALTNLNTRADLDEIEEHS